MMLLKLSKLLDQAQLTEVVRLIGEAEMVDGRLTAGTSAKLVKNNLQASHDLSAVRSAAGILLDALRTSQPFLLNARPKAILPPIFARYEVGMSYGRHLDNAVMGNVPLRTDIAVTVFLNDGTEYSGGELIVHSDYGPFSFKGDAGDAIVYPANTIHQVREVTEGSRLVAVTWVQSMIRNPDQRRILFDLGMLTHLLKQHNSSHEVQELADRCKCNLFRMWAEP